MKLKALLLLAAIVGVWVSFEVAYVYRLASTERVLTKVAVKLSAQEDDVYLTLPRGSYVCAFANTPDMSPAFSGTARNTTQGTVDTTISCDGRTLAAKNNAQWLTFRVRDDNYSVIDIHTSVHPNSNEPLYLIVGGTF